MKLCVRVCVTQHQSLLLLVHRLSEVVCMCVTQRQWLLILVHRLSEVVCMCVTQRQWLLILEEAKRKKMSLDNQRKESTTLQHESVSAQQDSSQ